MLLMATQRSIFELEIIVTAGLSRNKGGLVLKSHCHAYSIDRSSRYHVYKCI